MDAADLLSQLLALSDSVKTTNALITRLAKLQFQPGSERLQGDASVRVELAQDIHDSLKQLEEDVEFLRQEAEGYQELNGQRRRRDSSTGAEARLSAKVARLGEELVHARQHFRNAQIAAKYASEKAKREEREALLADYRREAEQIALADDPAAPDTAGSAREQLFARRSKHQPYKQWTKDEILVNASSDVTAALRRTHDLLSTELSRSRFAQETFDESTAALADLGEQYGNLDSILTNSRNLLGTLLRSQKSDTWYLETAFWILVTTLCWLFFRRILFGPFVKLPLFSWNVFAFFTNWIILRPLLFLLTLIGVNTSSKPGGSPPLSSSVATPSSSRPPLIVQPSAQGRAQPIPEKLREKRAGVPAGAGGQGAKVKKNPTLEGELSETIGKMAEESTQQNEAPVRRGDGTVLQERTSDEPPNPKKKQFEADAEDAKQEMRDQQDDREPVTGGDGTILEGREQAPKNPQKRDEL